MIQGRQDPVVENLRFLIPQRDSVQWGEGRDLDKGDIMRELIGDGIRPQMGKRRDSECMAKYLKRIDVSGLQDPKLTSWGSFIPCKSPLLDYLVVAMEEREADWRFPRLDLLKEFQKDRGLSYNMLQECVVKEIVVGKSSPSEIKEISEWMNAMHERDQVSLPCSAISLDVEDQQTLLYDVYRMSGKLEFTEKKKVLATTLEKIIRPGLPKDKWRQVPAKIMFGNGCTWTVIISVDLGLSSSPWLTRSSVQDDLVDLLENIPVCVGLGIKADVLKIEEFFSLLANRPVKMKGFVDLAVLSVIAGWKMYGRGMTCMGVQVIGTLLNKCVSTGDNRWGQNWRNLSDPLQVYGLGDIKFGYITMVVFMGILLRDFFPDPDAVCKQLRLYQDDATRWFCELIINSALNTEIDGDKAKESSTRESLIRSIRYRNEDGSRSTIPPASIQMLEGLLGEWPDITNGGCRFLLHARLRFIYQCEVIKDSGITWNSGEIMKPMDEDDRLYLLFGRSSSDLSESLWKIPVEVETLGLLHHPAVQSKVLRFDPTSIERYGEIVTQCKSKGLSPEVGSDRMGSI